MTRAEELAEKVRAVFGGSRSAPWYAPADAALSELVADAEALAEALKGLLHYAGGEIPAHHVAKAELALARYRGSRR